jgi:hypothetical protein
MMRKGIWAILAIACLLFGCGADPDSDQARIEKDKIDKVAGGASAIGYDGEKIEKGLRDVEDLAKEHDEAAKEISGE